MRNRIVITGLGIMAPNGHGLKEYEQALREGRSGIRFIPRLKELGFACQVGGVPQGYEELRGQYFDAEDLLSVNDNIGYAGIAAIDAWRDAGFTVPKPDSTEVNWDTGAVMGSGIGGMETIAGEVVPKVNSNQIRRLGSTIVQMVMNSSTSAKIAGMLALGNQVTSNSSACSTGNEAIIDSMVRIRSGLAKRMIAGGSEGSSPYIWAGFDSMRVMCRKSNNEPEKASRPMSATASGFVPGSGAGALILEDLETARQRGAKIYAELLGGAVNCGGHRNGGSMTAPNPESVQRCIRAAVADAGISVAEVDAINGHLTATFADPYEVKNWAVALERTPANFPWINATKSLVGHCLGGAGAVESVGVVLQLCKGFIHPSVNSEDVHPEITAFAPRIPQTMIEDANVKIIAKAGFGFGDVNSCMIFKKWEE